MYYELYIDSLFLVNFVMNLYLLLLVKAFAKCTATRLRIVAAAAAGATAYCLMLILTGISPIIKLVAGIAMAVLCMIGIAFRPVTLRAFIRLTENLIGVSFVFGGAFLFLLNLGGRIGSGMLNVTGVLGIGGLLSLFISYLLEKKKSRPDAFCKVILTSGSASVTVQALLDSGNGLTEPISGKPVSVLDKGFMDQLWKDEEPKGFRAIPYHSVGCPNGIMPGYLVPEIIVEQDGIRHIFKDIYVGISGQNVASDASYGMILNPKLLEGESAYDTKSGNAGRHTIQNDQEGTESPAVKAGRHPLYWRCGGTSASLGNRERK